MKVKIISDGTKNDAYGATSTAVDATVVTPGDIVIPTGSFLRATHQDTAFGMTVGGGWISR